MSQLNFGRKGRTASNGRPSYLRYDDVFMSKDPSKRIANNQSYRDGRYGDANERGYDEGPKHEEDHNRYAAPDGGSSDGPHQERGYFSSGSNIMDDRLLHYQKRRLPPLQRYDGMQQGFRPDGQLSYWDMREEYQPRKQRTPLLGSIWQKFIVTFASILSLVCVSWIAYNWSENRVSNQSMRPITIEPEQPSFKVLPENPGGPCIPHKGRAVYTRMNPGASPLIQDDENLLPPQEDPADIPVGNDEFVGGVEENLIIDDKIYYVKMSAGKNKAILEGELKLLRRRFANVLNGIETSVKKVSNPKGEQKHAILVGPFNSQDAAVEIARQIGDQCYIVSVKE